MTSRDFDAKVAAGQVLVAGFAGTTVDPQLRARIRTGELGGIILFKRNLAPELVETARLVESYVSEGKPELPLLVSVDQEGGRVARFGPPVVKLPPMRKLGELADSSLTKRAGAVLGAQLRALGFTMDFAPVLDVDTNPANPVIGDRAFGRDAEVVTAHALAFADGLREAGILSCGKHFPGHGDTELDSHFALPRITHSRPRLDKVELAPFRAARGRIDSLMTAHVIFDALEPHVPATLSKRAITGLLRDELRYDGVVFSDDLEMKAIAANFGIADAAVQAIAAGCDALLVCSKPELLDEITGTLVREAHASPAFAARLQDAAQRFVAMRQRAVPRPIVDASALDRAIHHEHVRLLEDELRHRLP